MWGGFISTHHSNTALEAISVEASEWESHMDQDDWWPEILCLGYKCCFVILLEELDSHKEVQVVKPK